VRGYEMNEELLLNYKKIYQELKSKDLQTYSQLNLVSKKGGLYIIFDNKNDIVYVGITTTRKNGLNGRLKAHFSGNINSSVFDKAINKENPGLDSKEKLRDFIRSNFKFVFKEIEKLRERKLTEDFIVSIVDPKYNYYPIN